MKRSSGVHPEGGFRWGLHQPRYRVRNLREEDHLTALGRQSDGAPVDNRANFPADEVEVGPADGVYEIPNALPFRGVTYIGQRWADAKALAPDSIHLPERETCRFVAALRSAGVAAGQSPEALVGALPQPLKLALATTSTDPEDLVALARSCARFVWAPDDAAAPSGIAYAADADGRLRPVIEDEQLYDAVANNPCLPDRYKEVMVLRPGAQGDSEIVGDWREASAAADHEATHVFEYLRGNSYIPWGHYAANMAHDTVRYDAARLSRADIRALRGLYYQRTYVRLAEQLGLPLPAARRRLDDATLERLRNAILEALEAPGAPRLTCNAALWGWNYGYDLAPSRYRLHASHQQIHQQFALVPRRIAAHGAADDATEEQMPSYSCGDLVAELCRSYRNQHGIGFFEAYLRAMETNTRLDGRSDREHRLVVHEAGGVRLFVPKAQTSQWELQILPTRPVGNVLEADAPMRAALDRALHIAMTTLVGMGARMVTVIEYGKRFDEGPGDQHLLYALLPRLPESPGAFSEAQLRWINGHYPEDFAAACRSQLARRQV